jgi:hypothetical protein
MVATILLACGAFSLLRTSGTSGDGHFSFHLRWTPTPEQRLLALAPPTKPPAEPPAPDA